jgi:hypothetical protein
MLLRVDNAIMCCLMFAHLICMPARHLPEALNLPHGRINERNLVACPRGARLLFTLLARISMMLTRLLCGWRISGEK